MINKNQGFELPNPLPRPPGYPHETCTYADLLHWHLYVNGTRPNLNFQLWDDDDFLKAVFKTKWNNPESPKYLKRWLGKLKQKSGPPHRADNSKIIPYKERVDDALFKDNPSLKEWKIDLDQAHRRSAGAKNIRTTDRVQQDSGWLGTTSASGPVPETNKAHRLPRPVANYKGSIEEILDEVLAEKLFNAIILYGKSGIGKTAALKQIINHREVEERFGDRRFFVSLAGARTADEMEERIVATWGGERASTFFKFIHQGPYDPRLLILDNLESPTKSETELDDVRSILADLRTVVGLTIVASVQGNAMVPITNDQTEFFLVPLNRSQASHLFASIAGLWTYDDPHFGDVIEMLRGIPGDIVSSARLAVGRSNLESVWVEWTTGAVPPEDT